LKNVFELEYCKRDLIHYCTVIELCDYELILADKKPKVVISAHVVWRKIRVTDYERLIQMDSLE